jgi:hypothetical protein
VRVIGRVRCAVFNAPARFFDIGISDGPPLGIAFVRNICRKGDGKLSFPQGNSIRAVHVHKPKLRDVIFPAAYRTDVIGARAFVKD